MIRLLVAASADGSYYYKLSENAKTYNKCRFHIKKERKKERLLELIKNTGLEFEVKQSANIDYTDFYVTLPFRMKEFDDWWYNCNKHQMNIIAEEVLLWDGTVGKSSIYSTTLKKNADFIQFVFSSLGRVSNISINDRRGRIRKIGGKEYITKSIDYEVIASKRKYLNLNQDLPKEKRESLFEKYKTIDGYEYCFSVPSEMLVLRRNNKIFITGNSGKSTAINQIFVCESLNQGQDVFLFSGELSSPVLKSWIELTMAGKEKITMKDDFIHVIDPKARENMRDWYRNRIWVYNESSNSMDDVLSRAISTTRKYGVKVWVLDNLMTLDIGANDNNVLQKQKEFIVKLNQLALLYGVLIVLIAHPRKLQSGVELSGDDISGASEITNLAQYLMSIKRYSRKDKEGEKDRNGNYKKGREPVEHDVEISILKNRYTGKVDSAGVYFDYASYRFYSSNAELYKRYKWNKDTSPIPKENPSDRNTPDFMKGK
jgi:twinkle protein